jgi:hypothetical protein
MKLVIAYAAITCRHRLNALAIARADQPRYIGGAHPPTRSMPKRIDERLKPALELLIPIRIHGRPPQSRLLMNHTTLALETPKTLRP